MIPAMAASIKDCSANNRMLVSNMRCTTISSCMTSIPAASKVIHCEASSDWFRFISLEQECRKQRQGGQNESGAEQIRHAEQPQFGIGRFHHHDGCRQRQQLED